MGDERNHSLELRQFQPDDGPVVISFLSTAQDAAAWASLDEVPVDATVLARWHEDDDVHAFMLLVDGVPAGYGEIWVDEPEDETELARIVIDPARRGRGLGRKLVRLLSTEAARHGLAETWLRVVPENAAAISCYRAAGFVRAPADLEATFNIGQRRQYAWMYLDGTIASPP
jgi:ribosomal protein S18 acetylase RimI-like enzyme